MRIKIYHPQQRRLIFFQQIKSQLPDDNREPPTAKQIADAVTQLVGQTGALDEESAEMLRELAKRIYEKQANENMGSALIDEDDEPNRKI